jgi:hypothetical protein
MKVSKDGHLEDPQLEDGKRIMEVIYFILYREWFPLMKERFNADYYQSYAIILFSGLLIAADPSKEELIDILYEKEIEYSIEESSRSRCEKIVDDLFLLMPRIKLNKEMTDDPRKA